MEYNMTDSKETIMANSARSGIRSSCVALRKDEYETSGLSITEKVMRKVISETYLCPCGRVDTIEEKADTKNIHNLTIRSEACDL